mgnify:CR=1 FL=1
MSLRWPASTRSSSAGSGSVMASGRPRTRSAGQLLHPTAGYGVHPGDTIAVSYDVSRTELWTGTCTGDDHTGCRCVVIDKFEDRTRKSIVRAVASVEATGTQTLFCGAERGKVLRNTGRVAVQRSPPDYPGVFRGCRID